jgi:hypothetical protein
MDKFLIDNNEKMTNSQLADHFQMKVSTILSRRLKLGLAKMEMQKWTEEQTEFLIDNYQMIGDKELAEIFNEKWYKKKGWTLKHIEKKRLHLALKRTPEQILWLRKLQGDPIGKLHIQSTTGGGRRVMIKTDSGYKPYAPILWQEHNGLIPDGHVITFKNGDPLKCVIENLEMITRTELTLRMVDKISPLPREMREVRKLIKQLNKTIKQKQHERIRYSKKAA